MNTSPLLNPAGPTSQLTDHHLASLLMQRVTKMLEIKDMGARLYVDDDYCFHHDGTFIGPHPHAAAFIDCINVLVQGDLQRQPWPAPPASLSPPPYSDSLFKQAVGIVFTEYMFETRQETELTLMLYGYLSGKTTAQLGEEIVTRYLNHQVDGLSEFELELGNHGRPPLRR